MICSVCQQDNDALTHLCSRCGVRMDRRVPPQLVLESLFTRKIFCGITVGSLVLPLMLLAAGLWGAWIIWDIFGYSSYWSIAGFAMLAPGTIFTLSLLPIFRRVQSFLLGLGVFMMFGMMTVAIAGLFLAIYLSNRSYG